MLNSTEHEIFPAHKGENANNCCHFNIYERENSILGLSELKKAGFIRNLTSIGPVVPEMFSVEDDGGLPILLVRLR